MIQLKSFERSPWLSELKVVYRRSLRTARGNFTGGQIRSPGTAIEYLRGIWNRDTIDLVEECVLLCLNNANQPTGWIRVSSGGYSAGIVDPKLIFGVALQTASSAIIFAHNHPSGNVEPSQQDLALTNRMVDSGNLLTIRFLDHIILSSTSAFSFREKELLPPISDDTQLLVQKHSKR